MTAHTDVEYARLKDAARITGLDYQMLYNLVRSGDIPASDLSTGKRSVWWVRLADVRAYIDGRRVA